jgi:PKD repeat protein
VVSKHSLRVPLILVVALAMLVAVGALGGADSARAASGSASFTYNGSGHQDTTIFDVRATLDDPTDILFGDSYAIRAKLVVTTKATVAAPTDFSLNAPDGSIRQDSDLPVTTQNVAKDGASKEFKLDLTATLTVHIDDDPNEDGFACDAYDQVGSFSDDTCTQFDFDVSHNLLNKDMVAPYAGANQPFSDTVTLLSVPVCQLIIGLDICGLDLDVTTNATLAATAGGTVLHPGFHADRQFTSGGSNVGSSFLLNWPSPDPVVDTFHIPCTADAGTDLTYNLTDNSYDARVTSATVTGTVKLTNPISDIDLVSLSANLIPGGPIDVLSSAINYNQALGTIAAENQPPVISSTGGPYSGDEGSEITFTATATDNCDSSLDYRWDFSDGGVAFGNNAKHAFADNGNYSGHLTVTDDAGNSAGMDFGPIVVSNVNPTAGAGPDKTSDWGLSVALHANGNDAGSVDRNSLTYSWNFNDVNSPVGAVGQDVSHTFSAPGAYNVVVTVNDKDGGTNTDTVVVTITKRDTTLSYTGALSSLPSKNASLSATFVDEFSAPVVGRLVTFTLNCSGSIQTANALTNGSGVAATTLLVKQKQGSCTLTTSAASDALYNAPANVVSAFTVGK